MSFSSYFKDSSHRFYGAVTALVMLTLYELLLVMGSPSGISIRNAPDAWFRTLLFYVGASPHQMIFILITFSLIAIVVFHDSTFVWRSKIFVGILAESIFLALISGFLIQSIIAQLLFMTGGITHSVLGDLALSIGAGLFEELFFRVFLTTLLIWIGSRFIRVKGLAALLAILIASFLFSASHYIGSAGDPLELYSFLFRFLAGIWFTSIYAVRGFAIVSLTHAFYDIFVLLF